MTFKPSILKFDKEKQQKIYEKSKRSQLENNMKAVEQFVGRMKKAQDE